MLRNIFKKYVLDAPSFSKRHLAIFWFIADCSLCSVIYRILFWHELKIVLEFILNVACKNLGKVYICTVQKSRKGVKCLLAKI